CWSIPESRLQYHTRAPFQLVRVAIAGGDSVIVGFYHAAASVIAFFVAKLAYGRVGHGKPAQVLDDVLWFVRCQINVFALCVRILERIGRTDGARGLGTILGSTRQGMTWGAVDYDLSLPQRILGRLERAEAIALVGSRLVLHDGRAQR